MRMKLAVICLLSLIGLSGSAFANTVYYDVRLDKDNKALGMTHYTGEKPNKIITVAFETAFTFDRDGNYDAEKIIEDLVISKKKESIKTVDDKITGLFPPKIERGYDLHYSYDEDQALIKGPIKVPQTVDKSSENLTKLVYYNLLMVAIYCLSSFFGIWLIHKKMVSNLVINLGATVSIIIGIVVGIYFRSPIIFYIGTYYGVGTFAAREFSKAKPFPALDAAFISFFSAFVGSTTAEANTISFDYTVLSLLAIVFLSLILFAITFVVWYICKKIPETKDLFQAA